VRILCGAGAGLGSLKPQFAAYAANRGSERQRNLKPRRAPRAFNCPNSCGPVAGAWACASWVGRLPWRKPAGCAAGSCMGRWL
jgi:hypothetical protein